MFSPSLAGFVLDAFARSVPVAEDPELDSLTPREQEVLRQIARGYAYKQIARRLNISVKTVETHVSSVLRKLHRVQFASASLATVCCINPCRPSPILKVSAPAQMSPKGPSNINCPIKRYFSKSGNMF